MFFKLKKKFGGVGLNKQDNFKDCSAVVDTLLSTLSRQSRICDCRHTVPTVSTMLQIQIKKLALVFADERG